jgi:methionyl-tRNA synthetase
MAEKFYLTTPIYYVNARPHIGHAYTTIVADVVARRHRLLGDDTFFLTGTDEHGQKIERAAAAAGVPPQQFADEVSASFAGLWKRMGITNDAYIRTTDPRHQRGVQKLFADLYERGFIELRTYTGQYCVSEEMFVEGPPGTIGPDGKPTETVSEENFFFKLSEFQKPLIDLIESNRLVISPESRRNEVLSFLRGPLTPLLDRFMAEKVKQGKEFPGVYSSEDITAALVAGRLKGEVGFSSAGNPYIPGALKDLSISRSSFTWGIPVPEPAASQAKEKHVIYVWLDALANYMTAIGYGSEDPADIEKFAKYWPADLHLVGKEIIRFHCVYWPAFLLALNPALEVMKPSEVPFEVHRVWAERWVPKSIVAHGWLLFEESKMSKSRGNIVRTETILDGFGSLCPAAALASGNEDVPQRLKPVGESGVNGTHSATLRAGSEAVPLSETLLPQRAAKVQQDLFAADVLRYFLLREIPFGQDGSFSFDALITRYNADLANGYGNLVSRTLSMINKNFGGEILQPDPLAPSSLEGLYFNDTRVLSSSNIRELATETITKSNEIFGASSTTSNSFALSAFLLTIDLFSTNVDVFLTSHAPWKLGADAGSQLKRVEILNTAAESIRIITALLYPILPYATASVWRQLGLGDIEEAAAKGELKNLQWGGLKPGTKLGTLAPIFPRADKGLAQIMNDMESPAAAPTNEEAPSHHPAAPPRTSAIAEEDPAAKVAGSHALTTERTRTPPHTEAVASGVFAAQPATGESGTAAGAPQVATISIDDFAKIDLRVAQIVVAERIPKADKLLRLEVDLGYEKRQILSGIAEWYAPEELIGRRIAIIANLAPRKMRGLESHGMLLAASGEDHASKPILASFSDEVPLGSRIK